MRLRLFSILLFLVAAIGLKAQTTIDKVVAVVGNEYVLYSDLKYTLSQLKDIPTDKYNDIMCIILDQQMQHKLLVLRAKIDSIKINNEQVEGELDRRMQLMQEQFGGVDVLEQHFKKTMREIKADYYDIVKDQYLADQMQQKVLSNAEVTPADVKKFYSKLDKDSLPYYNTELEVAQIVVFPKISRQEKEKARQKLLKIRQDIINGKDKFDFDATIYSDDPGSSTRGGEMEMQRADMFVPEFAAACLALKKDSISDIIETKFGFHIIKMIERKGELVHVRHILIKPKVTADAVEKTMKDLDSIRKLIIMRKDSLNFERAAYKYSEDQETKNRGGYLMDQKTLSSHIPVDQLEPDVFFTIDKLNVGDISTPVMFKTKERSEAYRILYLKSKIPPHAANLKDDYPKIKEMALEAKKNQKMEEWFKKYIPKTFIKIDPEYANCEALKKWSVTPGNVSKK